tara:strand:- start:2741 stop:4798 length:2058 start_codon:yes stop_codon:yes gene_type:complete
MAIQYNDYDIEWAEGFDEILTNLGGTPPDDDEVFEYMCETKDDIAANVYYQLVLSRIESDIKEKYPDAEVSYYVNARDTKLYINGEQVYNWGDAQPLLTSLEIQVPFGTYTYEESDDPDAKMEDLNEAEVKEFIIDHNRDFEENYKSVDEFNEGEEYREFTNTEFAQGGEVKYAIYEDYDGNDIKTEKFDKGRDEDDIVAPSGYEIADIDEDDDGVVYVRFQQEEEFAKGGSVGNRKLSKSELEDLSFDYLKKVNLLSKISKKSYQNWAKGLKSKDYTLKEAQEEIMRLARESKLIHKIGKSNHQNFMKKNFAKGGLIDNTIHPYLLQQKVGKQLKTIKGLTEDEDRKISDEMLKKNNQQVSLNINYSISKDPNYYAKGGSIRRTNNSPLLRYTNYEDGWTLNLLKLNPLRNQDGLKYKGNYKYGISRQGPGAKQEVWQFETLKEADKKYDELVDFSKTYSKIENKGKVEANYAKGGLLRVLKDSGFNHHKGSPKNELKHNREQYIATIGKDNMGEVVHLDKYTPNTKRFISSTSFDNPKKLAEYLDKNQIYAKGGVTDNLKKYYKEQKQEIEKIKNYGKGEYEVAYLPTPLGSKEYAEVEANSWKEAVDIVKKAYKEDGFNITNIEVGIDTPNEYLGRFPIEDIINPNKNYPTYAKGGEVKKKEKNEMIIGGLAGILLGIFLNK